MNGKTRLAQLLRNHVTERSPVVSARQSPRVAVPLPLVKAQSSKGTPLIVLFFPGVLPPPRLSVAVAPVPRSVAK